MTGGWIRDGGGARPRGGRSPAGRRGALLAASLLFAAAMLLALSAGKTPAGPAPGGKNSGTADPLANVKVGRWIRFDGPIQEGSTALCEELRLLTGDFLDDDWALRGYVTAVDTTKHEIVIGGIHIQTTDDTGFDSPKKAFRLADVRAGLLVEVEGTYLKNRRFVAREVDDESDEARYMPWAQNRVRVVAKVERVDRARRLIVAMGFAVQLTDSTRIRTVIE